MSSTLADRLADALALADDGFALVSLAPGPAAELRLARGATELVVTLSPADGGARAYRRTGRFAVAYRRDGDAAPPLAIVDAFVARLASRESRVSAELMAALYAPPPPSRGPAPAAFVAPPEPRAPEALVHKTAARSPKGRPLRVVLANLCEDPCDYGPGASEYLRAKLLSVPAIADGVEIVVLFLSGLDPDAFAELIASHAPDLVGFTCYSWNLDATAKTTRRLRALTGERRGAPVVVWGGVSFALLRARSDWFDWWGDVDAVAIGSGEQTIVDLVSRLLARGPGAGLGEAPIGGALLSVDGRLIDGGLARAPRDLSEVPSPYQLGAAFRVARPFVEMARGCRFQCAFCSDARDSREGLWMTSAVERIAADIGAVARWPEAREIDAGASTANVSDAHFAEVCEGIRRGDPASRLSYSLQMYPAIVRPSQRAALEGVRVKRIGIGVQSSTPEAWGPMRRKSTIEHIRRSAEILRGLPIYVTVLLGLPGETYGSFARMLDELLAVGDVSLAVHRLLVLPGTQFHARHDELGLEFDPGCFYRIRATRSMSRDDLSRAQELVRARAHASGFTELGERRVDWTNFDDQRLAFDGAPAPPRAGSPIT